MGKIREYNNTQTVDPSPLAQAAYRVEKTGMIEGAALTRTGEQGAHVLNQFENSMAITETSDIAKQVSALDLETTKQYEAAKQNGDMSDPEFAQKFVEKNLAPKLDSLGEGVYTRQGQAMVEEARTKMTSEYTKRGLVDQANYAGVQAVENYKGSVTAYANMAELDPTTTDHSAAMIDTLVGSVPAEHRPELANAAKAEIYSAGAKGYIDAALKNPNATDATLDQAWAHIADPKNGFISHVSPDTFSALNKQYLTAKESLGAVRSQIADQNWGNLVARVQNNGGNDVDGAAANLIATYHGKTAAETQVWKAQHTKELNEAVAYGKAAGDIPTMPEADATAKISDLNFQIDRASPDKVGELQMQQKAMVTALKKRDQEFSADPSLYAVTHSPVVASRYQDYANNPNPKTFEAFATANIAEQQRLYPTQQPRLVTSDMEQRVGSDISAIPMTPEGATQVGTMLNTYSELTGRYWPQISQELFHDKVLNPQQFVAASMWSKPEARGIAQDLLRASVMKPEELSASAVTTAKADKLSRTALAPLAATLHDSANGGQLMSAYEKSLSTLIQYKGDPTAAAAIAGKMIMGEYQFAGTLRMPTNVNMSAVVSGTKSVQADIGNHKLIVPPSYTGAGPHDQRAEYVRATQQYGHWATSSSGNTALLYDEQGAPVYETVHGHPAQVELKWSDLQKLGGG